MSAAIQVFVGLALAPPGAWSAGDLRGRAALFTIIAYAIAAVATIGYLLALASGPASVVVPLVATSPALAGALAIAFSRRRAVRADSPRSPSPWPEPSCWPEVESLRPVRRLGQGIVWAARALG